MKKVKVKKVFTGILCEPIEAECSFCGGKEICARSERKVHFNHFYNEAKLDLKYLKPAGIFKNYDLYWVKINDCHKTHKEERSINICKNCASQIAKQL